MIFTLGLPNLLRQSAPYAPDCCAAWGAIRNSGSLILANFGDRYPKIAKNQITGIKRLGRHTATQHAGDMDLHQIGASNFGCGNAMSIRKEN
ncbi:hypothetical protein AB4Z32_15230 [Massilia sp. 2TAF26]|uniref:hypothetical protein n=1 Tax=Massilia sp. 2TAF26 TaxID=3233012 RepID=UPI003F96877C